MKVIKCSLCGREEYMSDEAIEFNHNGGTVEYEFHDCEECMQLKEQSHDNNNQ